MKKFLLLLAFIIPTFCKAQSTQTDATKPKEISRFTIIQSPIAAKLTFKLDTYIGNVYQLVVDSSGKNLWQLMTREVTLLPDTRYSETRNYNLFVSTLGMRYTYLINTNTGATWQLFEDTNTKAYFFAPMNDQ